jgi:potassium-transporting ATPase potassium-binding subunit
MSANGVAQLLIYLAVLLVLVKPLGGYMAAVYEGRSPVTRFFAQVL